MQQSMSTRSVPSVRSENSGPLNLPIKEYEPDLENSEWMLEPHHKQTQSKHFSYLEPLRRIELHDGIGAMESVLGNSSTRSECFTVENDRHQIIYLIALYKSQPATICRCQKTAKWRVSGPDGSLVFELDIVSRSKDNVGNVYYQGKVPIGYLTWSNDKTMRVTCHASGSTSSTYVRYKIEPTSESSVSRADRKTSSGATSGLQYMWPFSGQAHFQVIREEKGQAKVTSGRIVGRCGVRPDYRGENSSCPYVQIDLSGSSGESAAPKEKAMLLMAAVAMRVHNFFKNI